MTLRLPVIFASLGLLALPGCAAVALTAGGLVGSVGVNHTLNGIAYKTFTAPMRDMRVATLRTLNRMEIKVTKDEKTETGWTIEGTALERTIDVKLVALTKATTRMRVVTSEGAIFKDGATSAEIILQTAQRVQGINSARR